MTTWQYVWSATYNEDLLWGVPTFDSFFRSFGSVFQIITLEAWTPIMYMCADAGGSTMATVFFLILVVVGNWFSLNLFLAVFETETAKKDDDEEAEGNLEEEEAAAANNRQSLRNTKLGRALTLRRQKTVSKIKTLPPFFHDTNYQGEGEAKTNGKTHADAADAAGRCPVRTVSLVSAGFWFRSDTPHHCLAQPALTNYVLPSPVS